MAGLVVEIPGGGQMTMSNANEVDLWNQAAEDYINEYGFTKVNDLKMLGVILSYEIHIHRAQQDMADPKKAGIAAGAIEKLTTSKLAVEKQLGIDKKSREAGGQHDVKDYLTRLKRAAHEKGVHISERVKAYEGVCMEARTKIRMLRNLDAEDLRHHSLTPETFIGWLETELAKLEDKDKDWAKTKGRLWVGTL